jgi:hypothetical protein
MTPVSAKAFAVLRLLDAPDAYLYGRLDEDAPFQLGDASVPYSIALELHEAGLIESDESEAVTLTHAFQISPSGRARLGSH